MGRSEFSKVDESDLAFSRQFRRDYWCDEYDAPIKHCPHCGAFLRKNRDVKAVVIKDPQENSLKTEKECKDCGSSYIRISKDIRVPPPGDIDLNDGPQF